MKKLMLFGLLCMVFSQSQAQQEPLYSQYMFNNMLINPGYTGSHPYFSATLLYRQQWVGFEGAPQTFTASVDGPLPSENMGVGFTFSNDRIGVTNHSRVFANYSYKLKLGAGKMSFGLSGGVVQYSAKVEQLTTWDSGDPIYQNNLTEIIPGFGFGTYYWVEGKWYAGLSVPTLMAWENDVSVDINKSSFQRRHYYLMGGYVFDLNDEWKFRPSTLLRYVTNAPFQADITAAALYKETLWIGFSYRTGDAVSVILEYQANKRFRIGYSFDLTQSGLRDYTPGSHELMIGYEFGKDFTKIKSTRFF